MGEYLHAAKFFSLASSSVLHVIGMFFHILEAFVLNFLLGSLPDLQKRAESLLVLLNSPKGL
jgi:hypothetical protein